MGKLENSKETYMQRALQLAKNGIGSTRPNPSVGAVIVCDDKIIGEGFTSAYGGSHAEVHAINSVKNKELLKSATIYVTLEPCSHYGKTPPCSDLIIEKGIPNIVVACLDDNELVAGKGIEKLRNAGRNVTVGILEKECKNHHKRFFTFQNKKRPYIILKWAETKDGFIAPKTKNEQKPVWISNSYSQQIVHKWRSEEHAILVGTNTVITDNPKLNVRSWGGNNPIRVVLDKGFKIPLEMAVFKERKTIVFVDKNTVLNNTNDNLIIEKIDFSKHIGQQICDTLYKHNIQSIIIEGGKQTLETFIDDNLWDEARVFVGDAIFKEGVKAPEFRAIPSEEKNILSDKLYFYKQSND